MGVVGVGRRDAHGQWQPSPVGQQMDLASRLAAVDRVWPGQLPLLSARFRDGVHDGVRPVDRRFGAQLVERRLV